MSTEAEAPTMTRPTLVPVVRTPHRAYPICCARELLTDDGRYQSAPKYPWCDRRGEYQWGDQTLCRGHAWKLATTHRVGGITPNGKWGSCRVHIDCEHSIDDMEWETKFCPPTPGEAGSPDRGEAGSVG